MASAPADTAQSDSDTFRAEVRQWLEANFPASLKGNDNSLSSVEGPTDESADEKAWREAVGAKGWGTPTWPKEYGGGGLSRAVERVVHVDAAPFRRAQVAEAFDLFEQLHDAARLPDDEVGQGRVVCVERHRQKLRRAGDPRQRVLDLVRQHFGHPDRRARGGQTGCRVAARWTDLEAGWLRVGLPRMHAGRSSLDQHEARELATSHPRGG